MSIETAQTARKRAQSSKQADKVRDPLSTYLQDHLAGSGYAIEILESLRDTAHGAEFRAFVTSLLEDMMEDREVLESMANRVGEMHLNLEDAIVLGTTANPQKFRSNPAGLGTFEALETLGLWILGKFALWRVLPLIATFDSRLFGQDFDRLAARALEQHKNVEKHRLLLAQTAFASSAVG
ncbi:MAG: hypothetical protein ABJF23_31440 [Bryobacteraceae bacterium]